MEKNTRRTTFPMIIIFAVIIGILSISLYYVYDAIAAYSRGVYEDAFYSAILAGIGISISIYITYSIRRRTLSQKPPSRVITTIECKKCGFKSLRKFEKGDFVFRPAENCQKCNEPMLTTVIYAEEIKN